jgi:hypothetical protein
MKVNLSALLFIPGSSSFQLGPPSCRVASSRVNTLAFPSSFSRIQHQHTNLLHFNLHMDNSSDDNESKDKDSEHSIDDQVEEEVEKVEEEVEKVKDSYEDSGLKGTVEETIAKAKVTPEKVAGRKKRVIAGYKILVTGYLAIGVAIGAISRQPFYGTGPVLASGVSYIMIGAAENSQLSSDTYKRLNIGLFEYGATGILAGILMKLNPLWALTCFIAVVNSIKGYGYGLKGWELGDACAKEDMSNGIKSSIEGLTKVPNLKSAVYLAGTLAVGTLKLAKLAEIFNIIKMSGSPYVLGTRLFRLAKLMLLTIVMFTLKDASDRDRLEGTTFIELNALASLTFGSWAIYEKIITPIGGLLGFLSAFTAFNGLTSQMRKSKKE